MRFKFKSHDRFITVDIPKDYNLNWVHVERYFRIASRVCCDILTVYDITGKDYTRACYMPPQLTYIVRRTASPIKNNRCGGPCSWITLKHKDVPEHDVKQSLQDIENFLKTFAESSTRAWRKELQATDRELVNNSPKVAYGIPRDRLVQCMINDTNALRDTCGSRQYVAPVSTTNTNPVIVPELIDYCKKQQVSTEDPSKNVVVK